MAQLRVCDHCRKVIENGEKSYVISENTYAFCLRQPIQQCEICLKCSKAITKIIEECTQVKKLVRNKSTTKQ